MAFPIELPPTQQIGENIRGGLNTIPGIITSCLSECLLGAVTPFVFSTALTPLGGAVFCGTRTVSSEIIQSALERAGCDSALNWIIRTVASNALAALVTSLALEMTFTFTAGIVFTLQTMATGFLVGCVIGFPLALIAGIGVIVFTVLSNQTS